MRGGYDGNTYSSTTDIYNIATNTWSTAQLSSVGQNYIRAGIFDFPEIFTGKFNISTASCDDKIFFCLGGRVDIYDASSNTWSFVNLSSARNAVTAACVGHKVFFAGGETYDENNSDYSNLISYSKTVDIYDIATNTWSTAELTKGRSSMSAIVVNDKVYLAGGFNDYNYNPSTNMYTSSNIIDIYDNTTNTWSTSFLQEPRSAFAAIAANNKIYFAGGLSATEKSGNGFHDNCSMEIRDINTGKNKTEYLFEPSEYLTAVIKDNKIIFPDFFWIIDGIDGSMFNIYNITTDTWQVGVLPFIINGASIISVNNTVYIAGGIVNNLLSDQVYKLEF